MDSRFITLQNSIDQLQVPVANRTKVLALAIANAVNNCISLPTSEVDNASNHYALNVVSESRRLVDMFNENMVFNANMCLDYVKGFWMSRYFTAYPCNRVIWDNNLSFFDSLCHANEFFSIEDICFLNENKKLILTIADRVRDVICTLENK